MENLKDILAQNKKNYIKKDNKFHKEIKNDEIKEIFKKPKKIKQRKIEAPLFWFQIDITFFPTYKNKKYCLWIIDINTRKAWVYVLKDNSMNSIIEKIKIFIDGLKDIKINWFSGDDQFNKKIFTDFLDKNDIKYYFFVSWEIHTVKKWNPLGIIDRFTRTYKNLMNQYLEYKNSNDWIWNINIITDYYNDMNHRGIWYFKPNYLFSNIDLVEKIKNKNINENINNEYFLSGDHVRILLKKNKFDKENQNYSKKIYMITDKIKNKYKLVDSENNILNKLYHYHQLEKTNLNYENWNNKTDIKKQNKIETTLKKEGINTDNIIINNNNNNNNIKNRLRNK